MAGAVLLYTPFLAAACMFALAGWLLYLNFRSPVNRSFAVFLLLVGMTRLINAIPGLAASDGAPAFAAYLAGNYDLPALRDYYILATPFALAYFLVAYLRPHGGPSWKWAGRAILVAGIATELAYGLDHSLHTSVAPDGLFRFGPLATLSYGTPLAYGIVALFLAWEAAQDLMEPRRAAAFLVSTALALNALLEGGIQMASPLVEGVDVFRARYVASPLVDLVIIEGVLAVGASLTALGLHLWGAARRPEARRKVALASMLYPLAALCSVAVILPGGPEVSLALRTIWRVLLPALVAYALVRHRLFSIDVKIKWTISRGTIAVIFLGLFFATSKVVENVLNERFGLLFGGISAGVLLFAISPLEKFGHRIAHAVMPNVRSAADIAHDDRLRLFEEQARLVWSDGTMGRRERRLLDNLRERLGLDFEEAARLEHAAALTSTPKP
ncbi:MAG: hypothetical protein QOC71_1396 [Thermoplasmata archaeon]|jgi:hypothetical protein|nr:hypothetical protein [Thermoplasmata archaeon]